MRTQVPSLPHCQLGSERDHVRNEGQQTGKVSLVLVTTLLSVGRGPTLDDDGSRQRGDPNPERPVAAVDLDHACTGQGLGPSDDLHGRVGRDGPELGSSADVVWRQKIHDRPIPDEAVAARGPTVRLEACVEEPAGTLEGHADHRSNVDERVDVAGGEPDRRTVLGFKDGDHLATDEDPRQGVEDRGDLAG